MASKFGKEQSLGEFKSEFNAAFRDIARISDVEDVMISLYMDVLEDPMKMPLWIRSIDTFYLLLFPHMTDKGLEKGAKSIGGEEYGMPKGRTYFEEEIPILAKKIFEKHTQNLAFVNRGAMSGVSNDGELVYKCRRLMQDLLLIKKVLGIEIGVHKRTSVDSKIKSLL